MKIIVQILAFVGSWLAAILYAERYIARFLYVWLGYYDYLACLAFLILCITFGWLAYFDLHCVHGSGYKYLEYPKPNHPLDAPITADHGKCLEEVKAAIRHEEFEYLAYFDLDGNKLAEGTLLSRYSCVLTKEDSNRIRRQEKAFIELHNHPGKDNAAFSRADFRAFLNDELSCKMIVVTKDYNYILEKTSRSCKSGDEVREYYEAMWDKCERLTSFGKQARAVVAMYKISKHFGLKFHFECVPRQPAKKHTLITAACLFAIIFYLAIPSRPIIHLSEPTTAVIEDNTLDNLGLSGECTNQLRKIR